MSPVAGGGSFRRSPQILSLEIEDIGVASKLFLQINPTFPQPLERVEFSFNLASVLTSAVNRGALEHAFCV